MRNTTTQSRFVDDNALGRVGQQRVAEVCTEPAERVEHGRGVVLVHFIAERARALDGAALNGKHGHRRLDAQYGRRDDPTQALHDEVEDAVDLLLGQQRLVRVPPKKVLEAKGTRELAEQLLMLPDELVWRHSRNVPAQERLELQLRLRTDDSLATRTS